MDKSLNNAVVLSKLLLSLITENSLNLSSCYLKVVLSKLLLFLITENSLNLSSCYLKSSITIN